MFSVAVVDVQGAGHDRIEELPGDTDKWDTDEIFTDSRCLPDE
jgi:hypothetical protein